MCEDDPEIVKLAKSIREKGLLEPLVVTFDGWIVSGHRRITACRLAGLSRVPCHVLGKARSDYGDEEFLRLLREYNRSREKSFEESFAEALVDADAAKAYTTLLEHRNSRQVGAFTCTMVQSRTTPFRTMASLARSPQTPWNAAKTLHPKGAAGADGNRTHLSPFRAAHRV